MRKIRRYDQDKFLVGDGRNNFRNFGTTEQRHQGMSSIDLATKRK